MWEMEKKGKIHDGKWDVGTFILKLLFVVFYFIIAYHIYIDDVIIIYTVYVNKIKYKIKQKITIKNSNWKNGVTEL